MTEDTYGVLLINLGTPDDCSVAAVRSYLDAFLMDPYVVDLPRPLRRVLVSGLILPLRPKQSAEAYRKVWRDDGSPLLVHSLELRDALRAQMQRPCELGMRYGNPSIDEAIASLEAQSVTRMIVVPLYPQHADSTRTTSIEAVRRNGGALSQSAEYVPPFYNDAGYLDALAETVRPLLDEPWDRLLLSYHGLPERHLTRADPTGSHCLASADCCSLPSPAHATCYRHQVFATSTGLRTRLGLEPEQTTVSFQSRLGRLPWLTPYTDQVLQALPSEGVRHLVVACPAFVADNLETLEEIDMQGRATFLEAGGETFRVAPCLNATPLWVQALSNLIQRVPST